MAVIVLLSLILLALLYAKVLAPRLRNRSYAEKDLPAVRVVIKNGCGVESLASDYAKYIEERHNIDVVALGDTPHPIYNKSLIEAKTDDPGDLRRLKRMTGIQRYILAVDPSYEAPFIIILGADFEEIMQNK